MRTKKSKKTRRNYPNVYFDIDRIIEPYKLGGTKECPVERTIGTISSKLMVSYKFTPDIIGAAIFKVLYKVVNDGLKFVGNGEYGSEGREFFSCIKSQCVDLTEKHCAGEVKDAISEQSVCVIYDCPKRNAYSGNGLWRWLNKPRGYWKI